MTYRRLKEYLKDNRLLEAIKRMIQIEKNTQQKGLYGDED